MSKFKKRIIIFVVIMFLLNIFPFVYRYLIVPETYPIGIWTCDDPYFEINFMESPAQDDKMTCTILVEGEPYTFERVILMEHPYNTDDDTIRFGKYVTKEMEFESTSEADTYVETYTEFETELSIYYEIKKGELVAYVQYSEFEDYPRGTKLEFTTNQDDKFTRYP